MLGDPNASSVQGQNSIPALPAQLTAELGSINGVLGVTVIRWDSLVATDHASDQMPGLVSCAELTRTPALGRCAPGASVATIEPFTDQGNGLTKKTTLADQTWPAAPISAARLARLPVEEVAIGTNGSAAAVEQARTDLEIALPYQSYQQAPLTMGEVMSSTAQSRTELENVTDVIIVASLIIAGCSLAVGVTAGIIDRKRPFSLLLAHRGPRRHAAPHRGPGGSAAAPRRCRAVRGGRSARCRAVPPLPAKRVAALARAALLHRRSRRDHRLPRA